MPNNGSWEVIFDGENPLNTQQTAVHACLIYNSEDDIWKVLYYRAFDADSDTDPPLVTTRIWDPEATSNPISAQLVPDWPIWIEPPNGEPQDLHGRLFCGGHCFLPNGKLLAIGGHREPVEEGLWARGMLFSYIFDPVTETWSYEGSSSDPVRMDDGRWYPTATIYGQGNNTRVLASGGMRYNYLNPPPSRPVLVFNNDMEIYNPAGPSWTPIANTTNQFDYANYPGVHVIPYGNYAGELFYSIPNHQAKRFNPSGPSWNNVGSSRSEYRGHGNSVVLPLLPGQTAAKVMIIGGAEGNPEVATDTCEIINLNPTSGSPAWSSADSINHARCNGNAVLLPDGKVLLVGGNEGGLYADSVRWTEVYDPSTDTWSDLVEQTYERNYHSTSILFPDGRVWSSGGEDGPPYYGAQNNLEIYSPAYLSDGTRPQILSAPTTISYNTSFSFTTNTSIEWVVLIKLGATTHAFDQDQRCIILSPGNTPVINGGITYSPVAPANANIAPPGYYMIFAVSYKASSTSGTNRLPSEAKFVKLS